MTFLEEHTKNEWGTQIQDLFRFLDVMAIGEHEKTVREGLKAYRKKTLLEGALFGFMMGLIFFCILNFLAEHIRVIT